VSEEVSVNAIIRLQIPWFQQFAVLRSCLCCSCISLEADLFSGGIFGTPCASQQHGDANYRTVSGRRRLTKMDLISSKLQTCLRPDMPYSWSELHTALA